MSFTIHTRTDLPKRNGSAAGIAYVIKEDGKIIYDSAPNLFPSASKARYVAHSHVDRERHTLGMNPSDFV